MFLVALVTRYSLLFYYDGWGRYLYTLSLCASGTGDVNLEPCGNGSDDVSLWSFGTDEI